ncbi:MAG: serine/threonine-protein kinase [Phycisphaerales bacterium]|nr:serine/threonine-protein kinase [Phycisphaerales bacterium]
MTTINPDQWLRIKQALNQVLDAPRSDRRDAVQRACDGDEDLRCHVEILLSHFESNDSFLDPNDWSEQASTGVELESAVLPADRRIGRYRVAELIGRGGMGLVFRARQEDPPRDVAIKILHPLLSSKPLASRFRQETRALARLQHPGIAQIFEAGTYQSPLGGLSYFTIELVEGDPITQWARSQSLTINDKLILILEICDAIQHAHQRAVIHRDLKPANIIVNADGRAKVLDFGIARLLDEPGPRLTRLTEHRQLLGTLPYMSPEQLAGDVDADVRGDVYSLGVIGYELLAGRTPHDVEGKSLAAALGALEEPPTPLGSIDRSFRGDLEFIFDRALARHPEKRYASVADLKSDLERYLSMQPVMARPAGSIYRLRKFARRNLVATVIGLALALLAIIVTVTIVGARIKASRAEEFAIAEMTRIDEVGRFFTHTILGLGPEGAIDPRVIVREQFDRIFNEIDSPLVDHPVLKSQICDELGRRSLSFGFFDQAQEQLTHAVELRSASPKSQDALLGKSLLQLGWVLNYKREFSQAEPLFREALRIAQQTHGDEHGDVAAALCGIGWSLIYRCDSEDPLPMLERSLGMRQRLLESGDPQIAESFYALGTYHYEAGDYAVAEEDFRKSLEILRRSDPPRPMEHVRAVKNLGDCMLMLGRVRECRPLMDEAGTIAASLFHGNHPERDAFSAPIVKLIREEPRAKDVEAMFIATMTLMEQRFGQDRYRLLKSVDLLAQRLCQIGRIDEAEMLHREAVAQYRSQIGALDPALVIWQGHLAAVHMARGDYEKAEALLREVVHLTSECSGAYHMHHPQARARLDECLQAQKTVDGHARPSSDTASPVAEQQNR